MRKEIYAYLQSRPDLLQFVRSQPYWYRLLARSPERVHELDAYAKDFYGKTFPKKMQRISDQLQMASMLLSMVHLMGSDE